MKKSLLMFLLILLSFTLFTLDEVNAEQNEQHFNVLLKTPSSQKQFLKQVQNNNVQVIYEVPEIGLYQVSANSKDMEKLFKNTSIIESYDESNIIPSSEMTTLEVSSKPLLWDFQWDMRLLTNNGELYEINEGNIDTTVAIIDSGISTSHIDLNGSILSTENFVPKGGLKNKEPLETGEKDFNEDFIGHGTFLAGQITANGFTKGIAPNVGIRSYRVFGSSGAETAWVIKAIIEAAKDDVDVINLSLVEYLAKGKVKDTEGNKSNVEQLEYQAYKKAVDYATKEGSLVVAAAGNQGLNLKDKDSIKDYWTSIGSGYTTSSNVYPLPASLSKVLSVGSVNSSDEISIFSNYGKSVDIYTYGGDNRLIETIGIDDYFNNNMFENEWILGLAPNNGYTYSLGTSISAAKISGMAALLVNHYDLKDKPEKVKKMLEKNIYFIDLLK